MRNFRMAESEPAGIQPDKFIKRTITAVIYALAVLGAVLLGNWTLAVVCAVLSGLGILEFFKITSPSMNKISKFIGIGLAVSLPIITWGSRMVSAQDPIIGTGGLGGFVGLFIAIAISLALYMVWIAFTPTSKIADAALSFFGALYLGVPLSFLLLIRDMNNGIFLAALTVLSIWAADSFAYLGGSLLGRHKMAPIISPKKSWEGFFFSIAGAILIWFGYLMYIGDNRYYAAILTGLVVAIGSLAGDLFESRIKREANVKDSGDLLPGHGGILDRIDSMLMVNLLMFLLLASIGRILGLVTL